MFLLPGSELPVNTGALVFVRLPPASNFKLLGALANAKQSAIFKINNLGKGGADGMNGVGDVDAMTDEAPVADGAQQEIVVGISIQEAQKVEEQLAQLKSSSTALVKGQPPTASPVTTKILAKRIIENAFNFLASFGSNTVPLKAFEDWWTKFERKIEMDPSFLEREQG